MCRGDRIWNWVDKFACKRLRDRGGPHETAWPHGFTLSLSLSRIDHTTLKVRVAYTELVVGLCARARVRRDPTAYITAKSTSMRINASRSRPARHEFPADEISAREWNESGFSSCIDSQLVLSRHWRIRRLANWYRQPCPWGIQIESARLHGFDARCNFKIISHINKNPRGHLNLRASWDYHSLTSEISAIFYVTFR